MSYFGQYQAAIAYNDYLYISTDYGLHGVLGPGQTKSQLWTSIIYTQDASMIKASYKKGGIQSYAFTTQPRAMDCLYGPWFNDFPGQDITQEMTRVRSLLSPSYFGGTCPGIYDGAREDVNPTINPQVCSIFDKNSSLCPNYCIISYVNIADSNFDPVCSSGGFINQEAIILEPGKNCPDSGKIREGPDICPLAINVQQLGVGKASITFQPLPINTKTYSVEYLLTGISGSIGIDALQDTNSSIYYFPLPILNDFYGSSSTATYHYTITIKVFKPANSHTLYASRKDTGTIVMVKKPPVPVVFTAVQTSASTAMITFPTDQQDPSTMYTLTLDNLTTNQTFIYNSFSTTYLSDNILTISKSTSTTYPTINISFDNSNNVVLGITTDLLNTFTGTFHSTITAYHADGTVSTDVFFYMNKIPNFTYNYISSPNNDTGKLKFETYGNDPNAEYSITFINNTNNILSYLTNNTTQPNETFFLITGVLPIKSYSATITVKTSYVSFTSNIVKFNTLGTMATLQHPSTTQTDVGTIQISFPLQGSSYSYYFSMLDTTTESFYLDISGVIGTTPYDYISNFIGFDSSDNALATKDTLASNDISAYIVSNNATIAERTPFLITAPNSISNYVSYLIPAKYTFKLFPMNEWLSLGLALQVYNPLNYSLNISWSITGTSTNTSVTNLPYQVTDPNISVSLNGLPKVINANQTISCFLPIISGFSNDKIDSLTYMSYFWSTLTLTIQTSPTIPISSNPNVTLTTTISIPSCTYTTVINSPTGLIIPTNCLQIYHGANKYFTVGNTPVFTSDGQSGTYTITNLTDSQMYPYRISAISTDGTIIRGSYNVFSLSTYNNNLVYSDISCHQIDAQTLEISFPTYKNEPWSIYNLDIFMSAVGPYVYNISDLSGSLYTCSINNINTYTVSNSSLLCGSDLSYCGVCTTGNLTTPMYYTSISNGIQTQIYDKEGFSFISSTESNWDPNTGNRIDNSCTISPLNIDVKQTDSSACYPIGVAYGNVIRKYPPSLLNNYTTVISGLYSNGTYIVSSSSQFASSEASYNVFDGKFDTFWTTPSNFYGGTYKGTTSTLVSGTPILGEWIQIKLPVPIILSSYILYPRNYLDTAPTSFTIVGSNDGTTWFQLNKQTNITKWTYQLGNTYSINSSFFYIYYRLIIQSNNGNGFMSISELILNGSEVVQKPITMLYNTLKSGNGYNYYTITNLLPTSYNLTVTSATNLIQTKIPVKYTMKKSPPTISIPGANDNVLAIIQQPNQPVVLNFIRNSTPFSTFYDLKLIPANDISGTPIYCPYVQGVDNLLGPNIDNSEENFIKASNDSTIMNIAYYMVQVTDTLVIIRIHNLTFPQPVTFTTNVISSEGVVENNLNLLNLSYIYKVTASNHDGVLTTSMNQFVLNYPYSGKISCRETFLPACGTQLNIDYCNYFAGSINYYGDNVPNNRQVDASFNGLPQTPKVIIQPANGGAACLIPNPNTALCETATCISTMSFGYPTINYVNGIGCTVSNPTLQSYKDINNTGGSHTSGNGSILCNASTGLYTFPGNNTQFSIPNSFFTIAFTEPVSTSVKYYTITLTFTTDLSGVIPYSNIYMPTVLTKSTSVSGTATLASPAIMNATGKSHIYTTTFQGAGTGVNNLFTYLVMPTSVLSADTQVYVKGQVQIFASVADQIASNSIPGQNYTIYYPPNRYSTTIFNQFTITLPKAKGFLYTLPSTGATLTECAAGTYCNNPYGSQIQCPAGYYCPLGSNDYSPRLCSAGYYCPAGSSISTQNQCPASYYCPTGSSEYGSHLCPAGYYCVAGQYSGTQNACPAGYYCDAGQYSGTQNICTAGYYCPGTTSSSSRQVCPDGNYCPTGSSSYNSCKAGYYCPAYSSSATQNNCPPGKYCPTGTGSTQNNCAAGYYCPGNSSVNTGSGGCAPGYYCPVGSSSSTQNKCESGYYCPGTSGDHIVCPAGTYCPDQGQSNAPNCPAGYYCINITTKTICPKGNYCPERSTNFTPCPVTNNYYCGEGFSEAKKCPKGYFCPFSLPDNWSDIINNTSTIYYDLINQGRHSEAWQWDFLTSRISAFSARKRIEFINSRTYLSAYYVKLGAPYTYLKTPDHLISWDGELPSSCPQGNVCDGGFLKQCSDANNLSLYLCNGGSSTTYTGDWQRGRSGFPWSSGTHNYHQVNYGTGDHQEFCPSWGSYCTGNGLFQHPNGGYYADGCTGSYQCTGQTPCPLGYFLPPIRDDYDRLHITQPATKLGLWNGATNSTNNGELASVVPASNYGPCFLAPENSYAPIGSPNYFKCTGNMVCDSTSIYFLSSYQL
jgi:hypothetical protein